MSNIAFIDASVVSVIVGIISLLVGLVTGFFVYKFLNNKKNLIIKLNESKIIEDAYEEAKSIKKETTLKLKEEEQNIRKELDSEVKEKKSELQKLEDRINQREEFVDKKEILLEKRLENFEEKKEEVENLKITLTNSIAEQQKIREKITSELEKIANMTRQEAKDGLIQEIANEAKKDSIKIVKSIEEKALSEADKKAQKVLALAIQRCATDVTSETTISVVSIPNDDMKGRIIGREGRNIRAFESVMGVDLIVDDTPETITISSFDPIRREIARISLEKLIMDGRIHPTRIEEIVEKVTKDIQLEIKQLGEETLENAGIFNAHPEIAKILGRLKYRTSYGQNCLKHSIETSYIAGLLASEIGADENIARRAGLLHDIGKALDHEVEGTHVSIGVELAKKYKESAEVVHCIEAHHFGVEFESVEAILVQVADAISSSRPGARRETLEKYVKRLRQLEEISNSFEGVEKSFALQAGREVRILVKPNQITDDEAYLLAKDIAKRIENEMEYPGQIKVNVIRESRYIELAK